MVLDSLYTNWIIPVCIVFIIFGAFIYACYRFYNTAPVRTCEEAHMIVANAIYPHLPKNLCTLVAKFTVALQYVKTNTIGRLHFSHTDMLFNYGINGGFYGEFSIEPIDDPTEIQFHQLIGSFILRHTSNSGPDFRFDFHYINAGNGQGFYMLQMGFDPHYMSDAPFVNRFHGNDHGNEIHTIRVNPLYLPLLLHVHAEFESGYLFVQVEGFTKEQYFQFPEFHKKSQGTHFLIKKVEYK